VVVAGRAEGVVDRVGEIQGEVTRDHREVADPMTGYRFGFLIGIAVALTGAVAAFTVPRAVRRTAHDLR